MLSNSVCNSFWNDNSNFAYQWRRDFLDGVDQRNNVGYVQLGETDGLVTALGDVPGTRAGYKMSGKLRTAFAVVEEGNPVELKDGAGTHSLSVPTSIKKLDNGQYLVTGTAATGKNIAVNSETYNWCFAGNDGQYGDYRYCPGLNTQASFWLVNSTGTFNKLLQANEYARARNEVVQTASALGVGKFNGNLYGVGYSSTGEIGTNYGWPQSGRLLDTGSGWQQGRHYPDHPAGRRRARQG